MLPYGTTPDMPAMHHQHMMGMIPPNTNPPNMNQVNPSTMSSMNPNNGNKRSYMETDTLALMDDSMDRNQQPRKKGRKKSFIWAHVVTDEFGKVHCKHCGQLIRVNYGEKVSLIM
jgi:hypothetical protein